MAQRPKICYTREKPIPLFMPPGLSGPSASLDEDDVRAQALRDFADTARSGDVSGISADAAAVLAAEQQARELVSRRDSWTGRLSRWWGSRDVGADTRSQLNEILDRKAEERLKKADEKIEKLADRSLAKIKSLAAGANREFALLEQKALAAEEMANNLRAVIEEKKGQLRRLGIVAEALEDDADLREFQHQMEEAQAIRQETREKAAANPERALRETFEKAETGLRKCLSVNPDVAPALEAMLRECMGGDPQRLLDAINRQFRHPRQQVVRDQCLKWAEDLRGNSVSSANKWLYRLGTLAVGTAAGVASVFIPGVGPRAPLPAPAGGAAPAGVMTLAGGYAKESIHGARNAYTAELARYYAEQVVADRERATTGTIEERVKAIWTMRPGKTIGLGEDSYVINSQQAKTVPGTATKPARELKLVFLTRVTGRAGELCVLDVTDPRKPVLQRQGESEGEEYEDKPVVPGQRQIELRSGAEAKEEREAASRVDALVAASKVVNRHQRNVRVDAALIALQDDYDAIDDDPRALAFLGRLNARPPPPAGSTLSIRDESGVLSRVPDPPLVDVPDGALSALVAAATAFANSSRAADIAGPVAAIAPVYQATPPALRAAFRDALQRRLRGAGGYDVRIVETGGNLEAQVFDPLAAVAPASISGLLAAAKPAPDREAKVAAAMVALQAEYVKPTTDREAFRGALAARLQAGGVADVSIGETAGALVALFELAPALADVDRARLDALEQACAVTGADRLQRIQDAIENLSDDYEDSDDQPAFLAAVNALLDGKGVTDVRAMDDGGSLSTLLTPAVVLDGAKVPAVVGEAQAPGPARVARVQAALASAFGADYQATDVGDRPEFRRVLQEELVAAGVDDLTVDDVGAGLQLRAKLPAVLSGVAEPKIAAFTDAANDASAADREARIQAALDALAAEPGFAADADGFVDGLADLLKIHGVPDCAIGESGGRILCTLAAPTAPSSLAPELADAEADVRELLAADGDPEWAAAFAKVRAAYQATEMAKQAQFVDALNAALAAAAAGNAYLAGKKTKDDAGDLVEDVTAPAPTAPASPLDAARTEVDALVAATDEADFLAKFDILRGRYDALPAPDAKRDFLAALQGELNAKSVAVPDVLVDAAGSLDPARFPLAPVAADVRVFAAAEPDRSDAELGGVRARYATLDAPSQAALLAALLHRDLAAFEAAVADHEAAADKGAWWNDAGGAGRKKYTGFRARADAILGLRPQPPALAAELDDLRGAVTSTIAADGGFPGFGVLRAQVIDPGKRLVAALHA